MHFRKATDKDISRLSKMRWEFQTMNEGSDTIWSEEKFVKSCEAFYLNIIKSVNWIFWIAEEEGKIISHVTIHIINNIPSPNRLINKWGYLTNSYTEKEYRNKGICSELIKKAIEEAKLNDIETLIVWPSNKSLQFYKRAGFTDINCIMELPIE